MPDAPVPPTRRSTEPAHPDSHCPPPPAANQLTQALIDALRSVNREVRTTVALDGKAAAAVAHFQAIAASLRTLADGSAVLSTQFTTTSRR